MFGSIFWKVDSVKYMARSPEGQEDGTRDQKKAKSRSKRQGSMSLRPRTFCANQRLTASQGNL